MFNQKSVKWSFLIASVLVLAACGEVGPSPSLSSSISSSSSDSSQPPVQYTITFKNYDDSVLSTQTVNQGSTVVYTGPTPTRPSSAQYSYTFTGWDKTLTNITTSFSTTAQYSQTTKTFTITWQNYDGTVLETDNNVPYGTIPTFNGVTPSKLSVEDYDFTFSGWSPEVISVVGNATYTAQFTQNLNYIPITTAQELSNIRNNLSGNYRLMNDIDLESVEWQPIGSESTPFSGTLDGKEFTISNLKITTSQVYVGLLGYNEGTIKNLKLANVDIDVTGGLSSNIYGGAFIGYNNSNSDLESLHTLSGDILIKKRGNNIGYVGGITGYQNKGLDIKNSSNKLSVVGEMSQYAGGIVGYGKINNINESYNNGSVSGLEFVGGLVSFAIGEIEMSVLKSFNTGTIVGYNGVGGLIGTIQNNSRTNIIESYNTGIITAPSSVAGLIGGFENNFSSISVERSYNSGSVNTPETYSAYCIGGLLACGPIEIDIIQSHNSGDIATNSEVPHYYVGGLVAAIPLSLPQDMVSFNIKDSYNIGSITTNNSYVGGLTGAGRGNITNSFNTGFITITGTSDSNSIGGLVGTGSGSIVRSYNLGNITSNSNGVGGLSHGAWAITNSFNKGNITGKFYVSGLGFSNQVTNSFNSGTIVGKNNLGGLIPEGNSSFFIFYSINFGNIEATDSNAKIGGIMSSINVINYDIEEIYYSATLTSNGVEVDGLPLGNKVTDLSTFNLAFFTTTLEWDTEVWDFTGLDIANGVYPTLKNMPVVED